jgi:hypothetical protein
MSKEISIEDKKVLTPVFRCSFPALFEPKSFKDQPPKYSVTMLFGKKDTVKTKDGKTVPAIKVLQDAAMNAAVEQWGAKADALVAKMKGTDRWPFHDGDKEKPDMKGYPGHFFVTAKAKKDNPPGIVDKNRQAIIDESEVYAGCYMRATLIAYAYDNDFGKGIGFALQNVQKWKDGEKFSGKKSAEDEFADDAEDDDSSDDEESYSDDDEDDAGF